MPEKFNQGKYINQFVKTNYDRMELQLPKGGKEKLKILAGSLGKSVNQTIITAVQDYYNIDLSGKK